MLAAAKEKAKATADAARAKADAAASAATSAVASHAQRASDAASSAATTAVNTAATSAVSLASSHDQRPASHGAIPAVPAPPVAAAAVAVGGLGGMAVTAAMTNFVAPGMMEMSRVPRDEPPESWMNEPTTCWCGAPLMRRGPCATLAKTLLLPLAVPAYALGVLGWAAVEGWNESSSALLMCVLCPKDSAKAAVWVDGMRGTRFGGAGVRRFARARRAMDPPLSCAESIAVNSHEFLAMNGKCWCCTCPTHAHQVHGHCVEAPCQVWLLDSDPNERPEDAGGEFCECG